MKKIQIIIILFFMPSLLCGWSYLNLYNDAISSSLNGAGDTIIRDSYAIYNNPANFIFLFNQEITFSYMQFVDNIKRGTVSYARKIKDTPPFCINVSYLSYGSIKEYFGDENNNFAGEGNNLSLWLFNSGISTALRIVLANNYFFVGGKLNFLVNHLDKSYYGILLNSGIIYYPNFKGWIFSLVVNNIGFIDSFRVIFPIELKIGVGYKFKLFHTELNYVIGNNNLLRLGNKIKIYKSLNFLIGIKFDKNATLQNNINLGIEINFPTLDLSYTVIPKALIGYYHYFSIKMNW